MMKKFQRKTTKLLSSYAVKTSSQGTKVLQGARIRWQVGSRDSQHHSSYHHQLCVGSNIRIDCSRCSWLSQSHDSQGGTLGDTVEGRDPDAPQTVYWKMLPMGQNLGPVFAFWGFTDTAISLLWNGDNDDFNFMIASSAAAVWHNREKSVQMGSLLESLMLSAMNSTWPSSIPATVASVGSDADAVSTESA